MSSSRERRSIDPDTERRARPKDILAAALQETGSPLEAAVREPLEASFRHDLRSVRVHAGPRASAAANALDAHALTVGDDVLFASGNFLPHRPEGRALLAHEVAHVVQNQLGPPEAAEAPAHTAARPDPEPEFESAALERSARVAAGRALADLPVDKGSLAVHPPVQAARQPRSQPLDTASDLSPTDLLHGGKKKKKEKALAELATARAAEDWPCATAALHDLDQEDAVEAITRLMDWERECLDRVVRNSTLEPDKLIHRCISFVRQRPADEAPHADLATDVKGGTLVDKSKVPGGKVKVRDQVSFDMLGTSGQPTPIIGLSFGYEGADSGATRWLQFVWRTLIVDTPTYGEIPFPGNFREDQSGVLLDFTTDVDHPKYGIDSGSSASPFYESTGVNNRTARSTTVFDDPSPPDITAPKFFFQDESIAITSVTSTAHLISYLVRGMQVLYRANTDITWITVDMGANWKLTDKKQTGAKVSELDEDHNKALIGDKRYWRKDRPDWRLDYFPSKKKTTTP